MSSRSNHLGRALRKARLSAGIIQVDLASQSDVSVPTVRLLEYGKGTIRSFQRVLNALELELTGRHIPPAASLGQQIALLRKRKELSGRALATMIGIRQATLVHLETQSKGRVQILDQVLTVLGAGAYLSPRGAQKPFYGTVANSPRILTSNPTLSRRMPSRVVANTLIQL